MLLLFSVFLIVAGKVGVDFIISDIFKACVLELGFIGEGVAAVALILGVHAGKVAKPIKTAIRCPPLWTHRMPA